MSFVCYINLVVSVLFMRRPYVIVKDCIITHNHILSCVFTCRKFNARNVKENNFPTTCWSYCLTEMGDNYFSIEFRCWYLAVLLPETYRVTKFCRLWLTCNRNISGNVPPPHTHTHTHTHTHLHPPPHPPNPHPHTPPTPTSTPQPS